MTKKFLIVAPSYYPAMKFGGPPIATRTFRETLRRAFDVAVLTTDSGMTEDERRAAEGDAITIMRTRAGEQSKGFGFFPGGFGVIYRQLKAADIIYFRGIWNYITLLTMLMSVVFFRGKTRIVASTGKIPNIAKVGANQSLKTRVKHTLLTNPFLRSAQYVQFTSDEELEASTTVLQRFSHLKTVILPTAIPFDIPTVADAPEDGTTRFLMCSRLNPIKNVEASLELFKRFSDVEPNAALTLVGDFDSENYRTKIMDIAEALRAEGKEIVFLGHLDRARVIEELQRHQVFLQMSHSEGLSNAVLEAQAMGLFSILSAGNNYTPQPGCGLVIPPEAFPSGEHLQAVIHARLKKAEIAGLAQKRHGMDAVAQTYQQALQGI